MAENEKNVELEKVKAELEKMKAELKSKQTELKEATKYNTELQEALDLKTTSAEQSGAIVIKIGTDKYKIIGKQHVVNSEKGFVTVTSEEIAGNKELQEVLLKSKSGILQKV